MIRIGPVVSAAALAAAVFAVPASAHTGAGMSEGLGAGLAHPFAGADHLLAMLAVGFLAGSRGGSALWAWPAGFLGVMLLGGALGIHRIPLPGVETMIPLSLVALGAILALGVRVPLGPGVVLIGLFALFHGHAHGGEVAPGANGVAYAAGFTAATALLHAAGIAMARVSGRVVERASGVAVAVTGLLLAALG